MDVESYQEKQKNTPSSHKERINGTQINWNKTHLEIFFYQTKNTKSKNIKILACRVVLLKKEEQNNKNNGFKTFRQ